MNHENVVGRIVASGLTCLALALQATSGQASCLGNFKAQGSIFKGRVYSTYADFASLPVKVAVERLHQQLPAKEIDVLSVDGEQGIVSGRTQAKPNQGPYDIDLNVTATGSGARVKMTMTLTAGAFGSPNLKTWMCDIVDLAATDPPASTTAETSQLAGSPAEASPAPATSELPAFEPQQPPLTNDDILKLTQAGVAQELIVTKIRQAPSVAFDLSTDGLIALSHRKVSNGVIAAMQERSASARQ